jgi:hypothetical protein
MKKYVLATMALAMGTALIAAPQGSTTKDKAPTTTTDAKGKKPKKEKKKKGGDAKPAATPKAKDTKK